MSAILKFDFQKRKQLRFSEVSELHKDPILHVTTTFTLKQGKTRTSSGPILHHLREQEETRTSSGPILHHLREQRLSLIDLEENALD